MRRPFDYESGDFTSTHDGKTDPLLPVALEVNEDEIATLREIAVALEYVEAERDSGHDIALCTEPESVGSRRSEFPSALPSTDDEE